MPDRLDLIEAGVWDELVRAAATKGHAWRTPVLATADGQGADARTVVIREAQRDMRVLRLFCDARSPKAAQVQRQPNGVLVMWSAALSWQLRLRVQLTLHTDGLAVSSRWARIKLTPAAQDYLSPIAPGTALDEPLTPERGSREYFGVIEAQVMSIDWLELRAGGHRRALFDAEGARWVQP